MILGSCSCSTNALHETTAGNEEDAGKLNPDIIDIPKSTPTPLISDFTPTTQSTEEKPTLEQSSTKQEPKESPTQSTLIPKSKSGNKSNSNAKKTPNPTDSPSKNQDVQSAWFYTEPISWEQSLPAGYIRLSCDEMSLSALNAKGRNGVVSTASPLSSKIGLEILKRGGNAVDAAVAIAVALSVIEPNASGLGGDGYMMVYDASTKKSVFIDYAGAAPTGFTSEYYKALQDEAQFAGSGVLVPGTIAGLYKANELYGSMSFAQLLQPAIDYAAFGFPVTKHMAAIYASNVSLIRNYPETARIFLKDGFPYAEGEIYKNPDFAQTLKLIAKDGPDAFYKGKIAEDIVSSVREAGGVMTMQDMANYSVSIREPVSTTYRGYNIVTCSPESCGVAILEALNMAETFDLSAMGHNSADALHMWAEIFKLIDIDRRKYIGDPAFVDEASRKAALALATKEYASIRVKDIVSWLDSHYDAVKVIEGDDTEGQHTTHISIIDKDGNMVSMTNTLSDYFGSTVPVAGRGFVLNNLSFNFSKVSYPVNFPAPKKRARSTKCPTFIFRPNGDPYVTIGTPGAARIVTAIPQLISNIIDFDMNIQEAIIKPRIHQEREGNLFVEGGISADTHNELRSLGHTIQTRRTLDYFFGGAQAACILADGSLEGGADPRRDGKSLAY